MAAELLPINKDTEVQFLDEEIGLFLFYETYYKERNMDVISFLTTTNIVEYIQRLEPMADSLDPYSQLKGASIAGLVCHLTAIDNHLQKYFRKLSSNDLNLIVNTNSDVIPFSRLTGPNLIVMDFQPKSKDDALSQLAQLANNAGLTPSYLDLYCQLKEREAMESTSIGNGIAIPHARTPEAFERAAREALVEHGDLTEKSPVLFLTE